MTKSFYLLSELVAIYLFCCLNIGLVKYAYSAILIVLGFTTAILYCLYVIYDREWGKINDRNFYLVISIILLSTFLLEMFFVNMGGVHLYVDAERVMHQAKYSYLYGGVTPYLKSYYQQYPNNNNVTILFTMLLKIFGNYKYVIAFAVLSSNVSALLSALSVRILTHKNDVAIFILFFIEVFNVLTIRSYYPYTSNPGILFVILIIFLYIQPMSRKWKVILIPVVSAMAYWIKITAVIPFIAIIMIEAYRFIMNRKAEVYRYVIIGVISTLVCFAVQDVIRKYSWEAFHYEQNEREYRGFTYFFMLGQNNRTGGQWDEETSFHIGYYDGTKEERDEKFLSETYNSIIERGILGNIKFYIAKTVICWGCTNMDNFPQNNNRFCYILRLCVWYCILSFACLSVFYKYKKEEDACILTLIGVLAYLTISEAAFTYVIMFSPVVFILAGTFLSKFYSMNYFTHKSTKE